MDGARRPGKQHGSSKRGYPRKTQQARIGIPVRIARVLSPPADGQGLPAVARPWSVPPSPKQRPTPNAAAIARTAAESAPRAATHRLATQEGLTQAARRLAGVPPEAHAEFPVWWGERARCAATFSSRASAEMLKNAFFGDPWFSGSGGRFSDRQTGMANRRGQSDADTVSISHAPHCLLEEARLIWVTCAPRQRTGRESGVG
jgi:hypothetical protein